MSGNETIRVGEWTADRMRGRLSRQGEERPVEPKVMELLFVLASQPARVFKHEELRSALWPDTVVGDDSLARCVSKLRRALSGPGGGGDMIETFPKRGYRLAVDAPEVTRFPDRGSWFDGRLAALLLLGLLIAAIAITFRPQRAPGVTQADVDRARAMAESDAASQAKAR